MDLSTMVSKAYATDWTKINNFGITLHGVINVKDDTNLNLALISCDVPPLTTAPMETYLGGKWYIANGRPDLARVTLTFRDYDQMTLYKQFTGAFEKSLAYYTDDVNIAGVLNVYLGKGEGVGGELFAKFTNLLIENVSQLSFSNTTENQIAEFSVTLRGERQAIVGAGHYDIPSQTYAIVPANGEKSKSGKSSVKGKLSSFSGKFGKFF